MNKISYYIVRILINLFSYLPFPILYVLSDGFYYLLFYILRYRRAVVFNNLKNSYPGATKQVLHKMMSDSYRNLADILIEGIKGLSMDEDELNKRYVFNHVEIVLQYLSNNQSVILANGHIGNWEWAVLQYGYYFKNRSIGIYKEINNPYLNSYIKQLRGLSSIQLLSTRETRFIATELSTGKAIILMGDQNPSNIRDAIWVKFMNQDTACLHGIEKYAREYQLPVVFGTIKRIRRGYYTLDFELITDPAQTFAPGKITQAYMDSVEKNIQEAPGNWLWSHKRWKHKRNPIDRIQSN